MWIDLLALVGAFWLIGRIVLLRAVAALPFSRTQAKFVSMPAPAAVADLIASADAELESLGFAAGRWMHVADVDGAHAPLRRVHVHLKCHAALYLGMPGLQAPNRLNAWFVTRLLDGRTLITQPFDCYFQTFAVEDAVVQGCAEPGLAAQWAAHCSLVATHGATDPAAIEDLELLAFNELWMERQRQALIASGALQPIDENSARPGLRFAWRMLAAMKQVPKPPADATPVPAARIALLAVQLERLRTRSPSRQVEFALFGISVALFMALGALLWDPMAAWMILVVVVIHELGHFLAMRAFGYRNVHMMALPLVGGVAIGQDVDPSAHRSAWMSLMGPLPGILIGWGIAAAVVFDAWPPALGDGWRWATVFLLINYLNVLPVPPLDGGHVVQALLPPRRAWLEVGFIAAACMLGAWAAWSAGFTLLTVLVLFQLLTLPARWQAHSALAMLARQPPAANMARPMRIRAVAEAMERVLGPTPLGKHRVEQALDVLHRLDRKPMRWWQTLLVAGTLTILLAVPAGGALIVWEMRQGGLGSVLLPSEAEAARQQAQRADGFQRARALDDSALLAAIVQGAGWAGPPAGPASAEAIAEVRERLGVPLPPALAELYRRHDGIEALGIGPLAGVHRAHQAVDEWFSYVDQEKYPVDVMDGDGEPVELDLDRKQLREWLLLGEVDDSLLLFNPDSDPQSIQVLDLFTESPTGYRSVREWMEHRYVADLEAKAYSDRLAKRQQAAFARLAAAGWEEVLPLLRPQLPWSLRLLGGSAGAPEWPGPASESAVRAAEQRLGGQLPADYRELLALHDGLPVLGLGSVASVHVLDRKELEQIPWLQELPRRVTFPSVPDGAQILPLASSAELDGCWALGGERDPMLAISVLCPAGHAHAGVIDLRQLARYPDLITVARSRAAMISAQ